MPYDRLQYDGRLALLEFLQNGHDVLVEAWTLFLRWYRDHSEKMVLNIEGGENRRLAGVSDDNDVAHVVQVFGSGIQYLSFEEKSRLGTKENFREEYYETDYACRDGSDKNRASRNVFRVFRIWMIFGGSEIDVEFKCGVNTFCHHNESDSHHQKHPFSSGDVKTESEPDS